MTIMKKQKLVLIEEGNDFMKIAAAFIRANKLITNHSMTYEYVLSCGVSMGGKEVLIYIINLKQIS